MAALGEEILVSGTCKRWQILVLRMLRELEND